jgi:glyoxylase-like metal-dependent hydrolase (beta-lactamase superfamily II)
MQPAAASQTIVHTYASPGAGSVNTHWLEAPAGIVVIDAQRLLSEARNVLREIAATGKPVEAIVLTHAHPDHIGGAKAFTDAWPAAAVLASQSVSDSIETDEFGLLALARHWLGDDFQPVAPTQILEPGQQFARAGVSFNVLQVGPGEATAMDVFYVDASGALFAADVVCNGMTPFLAERRTKLWLQQLDTIAAAFPRARTIYPGHGAPGDAAALIERTREYLTRFRGLIAGRLSRDGHLTQEIRSALVSDVERTYPGYLPVAAIPDMVGMNVDGVWAEMQAEL